jgi:16S rRNA processing protein RimM
LSGKPLIRIGIITAAHGIRGEVKVCSFTDPAGAIFSYDLTDASGGRKFHLSKKGGNEKAFIASVEGISDRNKAELLAGTELFTLESELPEKNRLIGLEARLPDGSVYGRITQLYNFGAGDIMEIELKGGKTEMLPLNDDFLGDIHADEGYAVVFPPEYMEGGE